MRYVLLRDILTRLRLCTEGCVARLMCVRFTSSYGITFQRGTEVGVNLEVYVDSDYASKATY